MFPILLFMFIYLLISLYNNTGLYADGAFAVERIVSNGTWFLEEKTGQSDFVLMQMFSVIYILCGGHNLAVIIKLFTFGCIFWKMLFYAAALWMALKHNNNWLFQSTIVIMSLNLIATGMFVGMQYMFGGAVFWFATVYWFYYQSNKRVPWNNICLLAISIIIALGDPSFFVFAPILIAFIFVRVKRKELKFNLFIITNTLLYFISFVRNIMSLIKPRDAGNRANFIQGLLGLRSYLWITFLVLAVIWGASLILNNNWIRDRKALCNGLRTTYKAILLLQLILGCAVVYYVVFHASEISGYSYPSRNVNVLIPAAMALYVFLVITINVKIPRKMFAIIACFLLLSAGVYTTITSTQYGQYLNTIYHETHLKEDLQMSSTTVSAKSNYYWGWTIPLESIYANVLNHNYDITSIIIPDSVSWEPFNSQDINSYPDLSRYGVQYNKIYFHPDNEEE
jgi:hypothetical protein